VFLETIEMATYNSAAVANSLPLASHGLSGNVKVAFADINCTAAPSTSDTINFFDLPAGARVLLAVLESDDMDTNGSPALTINVGDAGSATRYFSGATVGQAGTLSTAIAVAGAGFSNTAKTRVVGTAGVNSATGAAGHLYLTMFYVVEGRGFLS
jgi:hypothetical protein